MIMSDAINPEGVASPTAKKPEHPPATAETVDNAIRWFRANEQAISALLPLQTPGVTFGIAWPTKTLSKYIESWEAEVMGVKLAAAYIVSPLRIIRTELNKRKG